MKNNNTSLHYHKVGLALGWIGIFVVIYLSLMPEPPSLGEGPWSDKIGHSLAYTALMLWFAQLFQNRSKKLWIALGLVGLGIAIEFAQQQTGYRQFEFADMVADALGVSLGFLLAETPLGKVLRFAESLFQVSKHDV